MLRAILARLSDETPDGEVQRWFTSKQLATLAWQNSRLSDAQVRTYIMRLRSRLHDIGLEHVVAAVRNQGYGANLVGAATPA